MEKALLVIFLIAAAGLGVYGINMVSENSSGTEGYIVIACAVLAALVLKGSSSKKRSFD